jgi:lysozyme family protein
MFQLPVYTSIKALHKREEASSLDTHIHTGGRMSFRTFFIPISTQQTAAPRGATSIASLSRTNGTRMFPGEHIRNSYL